MNMENSVGRLPNQVIRNRANSSGKRPAHMENPEKTLNIVGRLFSRLIWKCQLMDTKLKLKKKWEYCGPAPQPARLEHGELIWKEASYL